MDKPKGNPEDRRELVTQLTQLVIQEITKALKDSGETYDIRISYKNWNRYVGLKCNASPDEKLDFCFFCGGQITVKFESKNDGISVASHMFDYLGNNQPDKKLTIVRKLNDMLPLFLKLYLSDKKEDKQALAALLTQQDKDNNK